MNDLDLLVAGAMVSFLSVAAAYITIRHRANELPDSLAERQGEQNRHAVPHAHNNVNPR